MNKTGKWMKTLLLTLLCLCLALPAGAASAEEITDLGVDGFDDLAYMTTLSDGRILLGGVRAVDGSEEKCTDWLLCLNPDMTVSWEYLDPACSAVRCQVAAEQADGTIGTILSRYVDGVGGVNTLHCFTPDGKAVKETALPDNDGMSITNLTKTRMLVTDNTSDDGLHIWLQDWDGNRIAECAGFVYAHGMIEEEDGLVLAVHRMQEGRKTGFIQKTDLQGTILWETEIPYAWPESAGMQIKSVMQTEDGGYLEIQIEAILMEDGSEAEYRTALVKLDGDGNILWTSTDGLENFTGLCTAAAMADGKTAVSFIEYQPGPGTHRMDRTRTVIWFDEDGKNLGKTELNLTPESFERLDGILRTEPDKAEWIPALYTDSLIPMQDGLQMLSFVTLIDPAYDEQYGNSYDTVMIKIPQP